ncbi:internal scaffolding protein [Blackfly microvirus SF02]|uniref:Internal scaffolding protein n=1 Tax=Blackfly microvirus SF02 TaxID=2576452 RepID=A0A4P8PKG5_9VIRU|nr:internal scaffolding protein [Blackfly microvirus SF02]
MQPPSPSLAILRSKNAGIIKETAMSSKREFDFRNQSVAEYDFYKTSGVRGDLTKFEPSLTRQEFAEECDINTIMARYEAGGAISHVNRAQPVYLDTTLYPGLQASMDAFREASLAFAALPASVRKEFDNDPQQFVDFALDEKNIDRMRDWGLAEAAPPPDSPIRVVVENPAPPQPDGSGASPKPA